MLKLNISGTKNDLKSFQKWLKRATLILPKYELNENPVFRQNRKNEKFYRYEVELLSPLKKEGGKNYVQSNSNRESKGWGWKNHYHS